MSKNQTYLVYKPDFELDRSKIENFLKTFTDKNIRSDQLHEQKKYMIELQKIANRQSRSIEVLIDDLEFFFHKESDTLLVDNILKNTKRYIKIFYEAIDRIMPNKSIQSREEEMEPIEEVFLNQRIQNLNNNVTESRQLNSKNMLPPELLRRYEVIIVPGPNTKSRITPLRALRADNIGSVVSINAIVIRTTDVKPFIKVACYACDICGYETYQIISSRTYMPLIDCPSKVCKDNQSRGKLYHNTRASKFISFQEIKVQEQTDQVPTGHVPRSVTIVALGGCVKQCSPGDIVTIHGIYLPQISTGQRYNKSRLVHETYIESFKITKHKLSYKDTSVSEEMIEYIRKQKYKDIYSTLAKSIAPEIYGMEDIKKALLLLLVGGVNKTMSDGMKIRGNINILLMGDPGVAKSQLLKYISHISPRGVYTTGKGSSGVGLTAAVIRDPLTNDLTLEGGALVLADMGICCIDEFDKMSDYDRANIHEVMEQQTVSIAKAGITTRLNARASVLAAANPLYGKYNKKLTPHQNINLPAALLSRFDLIFLLLDKHDPINDELLSKHVSHVHQHLVAPKLDFEPLKPSFIRAYIAEAKKIDPVIPKDLHNFIIQKYVEKRKEECEQKRQGYQYITPRTLLGIIRLAQCLARLRFSPEVGQIDVDEALRLTEESRSSINEDDQEDKPIQAKSDNITSCFLIIREMCANAPDRTVKISDIERKILSKNLTQLNMHDCLTNYSQLNVLLIDSTGTEVTLL